MSPEFLNSEIAKAEEESAKAYEVVHLKAEMNLLAMENAALKELLYQYGRKIVDLEVRLVMEART